MQLVKYGRQVKTIKHYRNAMQKMVDYLVEGDLVDTEASQEFQKSSAMLDNITGRKCKDATVHLHKKIEQTKSIDIDINIQVLRKVCKVENLAAVLHELNHIQKPTKLKSANKKRFTLGMGGVAVAISMFTAARWIDILWITTTALANALNNINGDYIILEPSTKFKYSQKKTDVIHKLSMAKR